MFSILKGEQGSNVKLTVYRKSEKKKFAVNITRDVIPIKSVDVWQMMNKTTGYIKINRFAEKTYDEFLSGLTQLKKEGANHIIIDLRDNGGGYLDSAVKIADEFLKNKELIVKTKNKKDKIVGDMKEKVGDATDNEDLQAEGKTQETKADLRDAGEKVKDATN